MANGHAVDGFDRRSHSVFINCPFDEAFASTFEAITFATLCCGFNPRCAVESGTAATPRMQRITRALIGSKYSIHDLSRCTGEGDANLARFNMPLELGIAMAERFRDEESAAAHDWLLLVPADHRYAGFISDLAGYDPASYDGSREAAVSAVMAWLATRPDAVATPTPVDVINALPAFDGAVDTLKRSWQNQQPWGHIKLAGLRVAADEGLLAQDRAA